MYLTYSLDFHTSNNAIPVSLCFSTDGMCIGYIMDVPIIYSNANSIPVSKLYIRSYIIQMWCRKTFLFSDKFPINPHLAFPMYSFQKQKKLLVFPRFRNKNIFFLIPSCSTIFKHASKPKRTHILRFKSFSSLVCRPRQSYFFWKLRYKITSFYRNTNIQRIQFKVPDTS